MPYLLVSIVVAAVVMNLPAPAQKPERVDRFDQFSVLPFNELEPGFTTSPRQVFTLDLAGVGREPLDFIAVLVNDRPLPASAWHTRLNELTIRPDRDLRVGLNRITIRYAHPTDSRHRRTDNPITHTFFVNHQRERTQVQLGEKGELIVAGSRRFIRGGFRSGQVDDFAEALPSARAAGFNMVHDYRFETFDVKQGGLERFLAEARSYLRRAHELGLGVFLGLPRVMVREYDELALATIVAELANEPSLWLWYVYDEPYEDAFSVQNASRVHALLNRLDPAHPSVIVTNRISDMLRYHPFCDVLWYDRYPILATSDELTSLAPIAASLQKALQSVAPGKPVWPVLQVHDNKGNPSLRKRSPLLPKINDENHRPSEAELRAQTHVAIAQHAMALVYYWAPERWYSMKTDTPGVWKSLSRILDELREIEPVLLSNERTPTVEVDGGHDKVVMWTRSYQGQVYVGLANASVHVPADLSIRAPLGDGRARRILGDGQFQGSSGRVNVRLGPAGVTVLAFPSS